MTKTYTVAGIATDKNGKTKVRYANNLDQRLKILARDGFTNINFIHSDTPQTKQQLCLHMLNLIQYQNDKLLIEKEFRQVNFKEMKLARQRILFSGTAEDLLDAIQ